MYENIEIKSNERVARTLLCPTQSLHILVNLPQKTCLVYEVHNLGKKKSVVFHYLLSNMDPWEVSFLNGTNRLNSVKQLYENPINRFSLIYLSAFNTLYFDSVIQGKNFFSITLHLI